MFGVCQLYVNAFAVGDNPFVRLVVAAKAFALFGKLDIAEAFYRSFFGERHGQG